MLFDLNGTQLTVSQDRDEEKFNKAVAKAIGNTFNFTCKAKQETFAVST